MTIQEQYADTIRHAQETWTGLVQSMTENVSKAFGTPGSPFSNIDPNTAIDQVFDFWSKTLDMQREVAKQIVGLGVDATEKLHAQADSFTTNVQENA